MLERTGIPTRAELEEILPDEKRLEEGPVAIFECFREIPCDPCYYSCPVGAVKEFSDLNDLPEIDYDKCTGCGQCIAGCPGLAVFVIDYTYSEDRGLIGLPYEFTPLPREGEMVMALDRSGEEIEKAEVIRVRQNRKQSNTPVVWLALSKENLISVRHFHRMEAGDSDEE